MSDRVGKRSTITNYLRLLKLDQFKPEFEIYSMGHGRND
jgi:hypothetical protein